MAGRIPLVRPDDMGDSGDAVPSLDLAERVETVPPPCWTAILPSDAVRDTPRGASARPPLCVVRGIVISPPPPRRCESRVNEVGLATVL